MAWQLPAAAGQWTAAMPAIAMPQEINMGSYTPEQWAALQQQNWQQWTQWQQQYSQWQNQYGEKYAQHLQTGQPMAGMPPLPPSAAAPPAPPPPDQPPPPPPPHENNQPLYGGQPNQPSVTTPRSNANYSSTKTTAGNSQWSFGADTPKDALSTVNKDALNKLAEEEKSFDIQFQKWEEEIERWRKENVNHPDKQSYREYEERFELCRAQLLERRQQMQMKRARLLNNVSQAANTPSGNTPTPVPPPPSNTVQNNYNQSVQSQNFKNSAFKQDSNTQSSLNQTRSNNKNIDPQDRFESYRNIDGGNQSPNRTYTSATKSDPTTFLTTSSSGKSIPGLDLAPDASHGLKNKDVIDITDDPKEIQQTPDYSKISKGINNILGDAKIMNILSMVQNVPPAPGQNLPSNNLYFENQSYPPNQGNRNSINFNQENQFGNRPDFSYNKQGPNFPMQQNQYSQQQGMYDNDGQQMQKDQYHDRNLPYGGPNNRGGPDVRQGGSGMRQGGPGMRQGGPGMRQGGFDIRQSGNVRAGAPPGMRQGDSDMRLGGPSIQQGGPNNKQGAPDMQSAGPNMQQPGSDMRQSGPDMRQSGPDIRQSGLDMRQSGPDMRQSSLDMRQSGPDMRQSSLDMRQSGPDMRPGRPHMPQRGPDINQSGQNMQQNLLQDMRHPDQDMQPSFDNNGIPPLLGLNNRLPLKDMGGQQNIDDYFGPEQPIRANNPVLNQPSRLKWIEEPLFTPSLVVDYDHKPPRLKARDFIEPVHTFDYNHKSKNEDLNRKKDFEKEVEELFTRKPRRDEASERYVKDLYHRDYERRVPREEIRDLRDSRADYRDMRDDFRATRLPPREAPREDFERRRIDDRYDDRKREDTRDFRREDRREDVRDFRRDERRDDRREDRDRFQRRDDFRERERERDFHRAPREDRSRDIMKRDDSKNRSRSKELESRKRGFSKENEVSTLAKKAKEVKEIDKKHVVMIDDLLEHPGRDMRPEKLVIIMRGIPGSGKSYLAKLIRDKEAEHGGTARIMSIDDYFMQEGETEEKDPQTGKIVKKPFLKYEYDEQAEESYLTSLKRAFKRSLTDGYFSFLIYDAVNDQLKSYADIWNFARQSGFQVYICTMEQDLQTCFKRNIHNRSMEDLEILKTRFFETPAHHIQLDATTLLQSASITEVQMEDVEDDVVMEDVQEVEVESVFTSKWEKMEDAAQLARLDGTSKPLRPSQLSMEDYLQIDEWKPNTAQTNKKTVRWADIEERREQDKMRAIGFVVGQTDWNRMTDLTMGSSALTQTKYIERVRRN